MGRGDGDDSSGAVSVTEKSPGEKEGVGKTSAGRSSTERLIDSLAPFRFSYLSLVYIGGEKIKNSKLYEKIMRPASPPLLFSFCEC